MMLCDQSALPITTEIKIDVANVCYRVLLPMLVLLDGKYSGLTPGCKCSDSCTKAVRVENVDILAQSLSQAGF